MASSSCFCKRELFLVHFYTQKSFILSCLSYCDFCSPRFFIMESVHNFVSFKCSIVLILALCCIQQMGHQSTFGVFQLGTMVCLRHIGGERLCAHLSLSYTM